MKEKIMKILILILLIILIYLIIEISAAYKTMLQGNLDTNIQPWVILVNTVNIATTQTKTFELNSIISETGNIKTGKIAPGTKFQIPIEIDATKTKKMDIRYDITINELDKIEPKIKIEDVLEENMNSRIVRTDINTYTGIITKENIEQLVKCNLSINLVWQNDESNNDIDTKLGISEERQKVEIPVTIYVSQYSNEEITEYTEGTTEI